MVRIQSLTDLELHGRRVLVRVDFNVPLDGDGRVTDDTRIRASLPTLRHILDRGGRAILMTHLGRPKGVVENLRLGSVADRLSRLLGRPIGYVRETVGPTAVHAAEALKDGECLLLENVRFNDGETRNDADFARGLAALGDIYVNDAFGTAHRAPWRHGAWHGLTDSAAGISHAKDWILAGAMKIQGEAGRVWRAKVWTRSERPPVYRNPPTR